MESIARLTNEITGKPVEAELKHPCKTKRMKPKRKQNGGLFVDTILDMVQQQSIKDRNGYKTYKSQTQELTDRLHSDAYPGNQDIKVDLSHGIEESLDYDGGRKCRVVDSGVYGCNRSWVGFRTEHRHKYDAASTIETDSDERFKTNRFEDRGREDDDTACLKASAFGDSRKFKCGQESANAGEFLQHIEDHSPNDFEEERSSDDQTPGIKAHSCDMCEYRTNFLPNLKRHIQRHGTSKPFKCTFCAYSCVESYRLAEHIRSHTGEKPYKCPHCSHSCTKKSNLTSHIRTHTNERPFRCVECGCCFNQQHSLRRHEKIHVGVKPFVCGHCPYSCTTSGRLKQHERQHMEEKRHACAQCGYSSHILGNLTRHMIRHSR